MKTGLTKPCNQCPFRSDQKRFITQGRVEEITHALLEEDKTFTCHKTLDRHPEDQEHCAGAMIFVEKHELPNQWMRIMERLGYYDPRKMEMDSPVFDTVEEMKNHPSVDGR